MLVLFILSIALLFMLSFILSGMYIVYLIYKAPTAPSEEDTPEKDARKLLKG